MTNYERVVAEIDLDAFDFNIKSIRKKLDKRVKMVGVVKADGYGHGALELAKVLEENGLEWFAVSNVDEGVQLRIHGFKEHILNLGYAPKGRYEDLIRHEIDQTVYDYADAKALSDMAESMQKKARVHIKIDSGMGRLGFRPGEASIQTILEISKLPGLDVTGMFTHLANADEDDKSFALLQKERFVEVQKELEERGFRPPFIHCYNSAAIVEFDDAFYDLARPGIILYGFYKEDMTPYKDKIEIKPVMSLKSHLSFVKEVEAGVPIGYGCTYVTDKTTRVATIPVGYADGYSRSMNKGGRVLVNGEYAPIIGRVCMDQMMVDVTNIPEAKEDDEVVLIGRQKDKEITMFEVARIIGTIVNEVVCMFSKRVPRVYLRDGKVVNTINYIK